MKMRDACIDAVDDALQGYRFRLPGAGGLQGELRLASATRNDLAAAAFAACIERLREPTMEMVSAAADAAKASGPGDYVAIWNAMLGAALNPKP